ncbi:hypothetical protein NQ315_001251 [Exocentrus adspersus]|uniref:Uncharacterized protein n=1 Tax=Exocentrus adspersus TaxID=1586481 RepID=A0AAV8WEX2_9CUCU|nr:hypothetical protein NQ315_001251 [Exocentrus adspersus]
MQSLSNISTFRNPSTSSINKFPSIYLTKADRTDHSSRLRQNALPASFVTRRGLTRNQPGGLSRIFNNPRTLWIY